MTGMLHRGHQACATAGLSPTCLVAFASAVCAVVLMLTNRSMLRPTFEETSHSTALLAVHNSDRGSSRPAAPIFYGCIDCEINHGALAPRTDDDEGSDMQEHIDATNTPVAFLIKTFNRPACALLTLRSILLLYPDATIIIADDSGPSYTLDKVGSDELHTLRTLHPDASLEVLHLPYDVGVSAGRNALVQRASERGIHAVVMLDDDYALTHSFDLPRMLQLLVRQRADIVGANRCESMPFDGTTCRQDAALLVHNGTLFAVPGAVPTAAGPVVDASCSRTHFVQNAFLARTSALLRIQWDPVLKNNDHYAFMYRAARVFNASMWLCRDMHVLHAKHGCQLNSTTYASLRQSRWSALFTVVAQQLSIRSLVDEEGKVFTVTPHAATTYSSTLRPPCISMRNWTANAVKRELLGMVLHVVNSHLVGGDQRSTPLGWNGCIQPLHPHVYRVRGSMRAQLANWWPANKAAPDITFDVDVYWPTCSGVHRRASPQYEHGACYPPEVLMHTELTLLVDTTSPIYIITATRDCIVYIHRLIRNLRQATQAGGALHLIIVDFGSTDGDVAALTTKASTKSVALQVSVVRAPYAFSRTLGLHLGVERVRLLSKGAPHARVFVVDTSIILPVDIRARVELFVHYTVSVWVPIVTKVQGFESDAEALAWLPVNGTRTHRPGVLLELAPVLSGMGMVGFCVGDYTRAHGYDLSHGFRWGGEDKELINSFSAAGLRIVRLQSEDTWHAQYKKLALMAYRADTNGQSDPTSQRLLPVTIVVGASHPWYAAVQRGAPLLEGPTKRSLVGVWYTFPISARNQASHGVFMLATLDAHSRKELHIVRSGLAPRLRSMRVATTMLDRDTLPTTAPRNQSVIVKQKN